MYFFHILCSLIKACNSWIIPQIDKCLVCSVPHKEISLMPMERTTTNSRNKRVHRRKRGNRRENQSIHPSSLQETKPLVYFVARISIEIEIV